MSRPSADPIGRSGGRPISTPTSTDSGRGSAPSVPTRDVGGAKITPSGGTRPPQNNSGVDRGVASPAAGGVGSDDRRRAYNATMNEQSTRAPGSQDATARRRENFVAGGGAIDSKVVGDQVGGVNVRPRGITPSSIADANGTAVINGNRTVVNNTTINNNYNNNNYNNSVNYITNVNNANTCWGGNNWCPPVWGPNSCWNGWGGGSGFSFGIGFGSGGFSLGLFYGSSFNAPLCNSWCNPWWDGWCGFVSVNCAPSCAWARPCWSPYGPWYSNYIGSYGCVPATWCTPVYAYTPTWVVPNVTYVNAWETSPQIVYVDSSASVAPPSTAPAVLVTPTSGPSQLAAVSPAESQAWDLLGGGFPRSAADMFSQMHDANPNEPRALVGYAIALAMLEDIPASAAVIRQALAIDPNVVMLIPLGPALAQRVQLLEQSATIASRQSAIAADSLLILSAWRTMEGQYTEAHFAVVSAQGLGEKSLGAARLRSLLETRLGPRA